MMQRVKEGPDTGLIAEAEIGAAEVAGSCRRVAAGGVGKAELADGPRFSPLKRSVTPKQ